MKLGRQHAARPAARTSSNLVTVLFRAVRLTWQADRRNLLLGAGMQVFGALSPTLLVLVGQQLLSLITHASGQRPRIGTLVVPIILVAVLTAASSASAVMNQQQQRLMGERVANRAWERVLDVAGYVRLAMYESPEFYDQLERIKNNAFSQHVAVTSALFGLFGGSVALVGLLIVLAAIAPLLIPIMLFAGVPSLLLSRHVSKLEFAHQIRVTPVYRKRGYLRVVLTGRDEAKEIRVFAAAAALRRRHDAQSADYEARLATHIRRRQRYALADVVTTGLLLVVALGSIVWMLSRGDLSLAAAAAAVLAVRFVSTSLSQMFRSVGSLLESSTYLADLEAFLDLRREIDAPASGVLGPLRRALRIRDLSFSYPAGARTALHRVDLDIGANEIVALVGENGSGKTTLAKIIAGLYRPSAGTIVWDDTDVATVGAADVRSEVSVIFQDFIRYRLSALDNIGLGDPEHAEDLPAARRAAALAGAVDYLDQLPDGFQTVLSKEFEGGEDLSMGQWQRVALARALRKSASLVVLDEPTASLDPHTEAQLFADIRATLRGRAALLISHRFSSVRLADRIYVLRRGRVVEFGTHEELVALGGVYSEMFRVQAEAYS